MIYSRKMLPQEEIALLEKQIKQLIEQHHILSEQVKTLLKNNDQQRQEVIRSHAEIQDLQKQNRELKTALALVDDSEGKDIARRRINALINKIDRTIELLNE